MLAVEDALTRVYTNVKMSFYKKIFSRFETRDSTLSAVETFSVEVIHALGTPTINEFARFVNISQANATYKVQSLIEKGYVVKKRSTRDRREYRLSVTDKFHQYNRVSQGYIHELVTRMQERFSPEELEQLTHMLTVMAEELMPDVIPWPKAD